MTTPPRPLSSGDPGRVLTVLTSRGAPARLRADAARNRARLLEAADRLASERGVANLTMEAVAAAAGVGKGTVFRRFGDRSGLLAALLDHRERQLQNALLYGPPPLGPGAPALERLRAFGPAVMRHEHAHHDLYLALGADTSRRYTTPVYEFRFAHVRMLLRGIGSCGDPDLIAHTLLGYLDSTFVDHLVTRRGMSLRRLEAGWCDLVDRLTAARGAGAAGAAAPGDRVHRPSQQV
ncbi:TetR/AcrR family transcriptional regulator [Thermomonospora sp. CIF 1]|uniref:TetR/AcrR family transcriptional regulator n=1 Tax=Thermomonospora sp. CIF 1 TaxID=1916083 RepID=UPI000A62872D|nr:TetR/AcrR family transcriptional regulator [Thermomonospora sp. CIF 1]PKK16370.1 MAG: TetR family transcriptional regulator [Thermomonospora sp. CIF 1]